MIGICCGICDIIPPAEMDADAFTFPDLVCHRFVAEIGLLNKGEIPADCFIDILEIFLRLPVTFKINMVFAFQDVGVIREKRFLIHVSQVIRQKTRGKRIQSPE